MKILKTILSVAAIILSVIAITLSSVAIANKNSMKIMDAYEIGLRAFLSADVTEMYAEEDSDPNRRGNFYDEEWLDEFKTALKTATYQKTSEYKSAYCYVRFETAEGSYTIGGVGYKLIIRVNGEKKYYSSSAVTELRGLISEAIELAIGNQG